MLIARRFPFSVVHRQTDRQTETKSQIQLISDHTHGLAAIGMGKNTEYMSLSCPSMQAWLIY